MPRDCRAHRSPTTQAGSGEEQCPALALEASAGSRAPGTTSTSASISPSSTPWGGARESQAPFPRERLQPGDGAGCRPPAGSHRFLRKRSVTFGPALPPHQDSRCLRGGYPAPTAQPGFGAAPAHPRSAPAPQPPRPAPRSAPASPRRGPQSGPAPASACARGAPELGAGGLGGWKPAGACVSPARQLAFARLDTPGATW